MTDRQFKTITKKLHFYNQGGIKNLCTMTETMLRQVMEEAAGVTQAYIRKLVQNDIDQQNKIALLSAKVYKLQKENAELKLKLEALEGQTPWKDVKDKSEVIGKLTKAKELLKKWVELYKPKLEGYPITPIQEQTEQFLNSEVEK